jgi:acetyltransferase
MRVMSPQSVKLGDGRHVLIRPIAPADACAWLAFLRGLSWATRYLRGARDADALSADEIRRATAPDPAEALALVAAVGGRDELAAVGRLYLDEEGRRGELALVVADPWQDCGLGHALLGSLLALAETRGVREVEGQVLATNRRMLEFLGRHGFVAEAQKPGEVTVRSVRRLAERSRAANGSAR